jgi:CHC2 zinc finger
LARITEAPEDSIKGEIKRKKPAQARLLPRASVLERNILLSKSTITRSAPLQIDKVAHHFQSDRLQDARSFYGNQGVKLGQPNSKGWAICYGDICPSHRSTSRRSFSVNVIHGGWKCFGCGATGDMLKFVMLRDGLSFKEACQQLGAWDDAAQPTPPTILVNHLVMDFDVDGVHHRAEVKDEPHYAGMIRKFYRTTGAQLTALGLEQAESDEAENCWTRLALGLDELREAGIYE